MTHKKIFLELAWFPITK